MRTITALFVSSALATPALATESDITLTLEFVTHVEAGVAEQDVYVKNGSTTAEVFRPGPDFDSTDAPIYASSVPQAHNPADPSATGPYPTGTSLVMTLGEWLGASGQGEYTIEDGDGHIRIDFEGLVPGGVYTIWHFFMVNGETEPFIGTFDLPIGALDGSQSVFVAEADGTATFEQSFDAPLQLSGEQLTAGLALNWHSDGQTYGVLPGEFGHNAHIQLFTALPARAGL